MGQWKWPEKVEVWGRLAGVGFLPLHWHTSLSQCLWAHGCVSPATGELVFVVEPGSARQRTSEPPPPPPAAVYGAQTPGLWSAIGVLVLLSPRCLPLFQVFYSEVGADKSLQERSHRVLLQDPVAPVSKGSKASPSKSTCGWRCSDSQKDFWSCVCVICNNHVYIVLWNLHTSSRTRPHHTPRPVCPGRQACAERFWGSTSILDSIRPPLHPARKQPPYSCFFVHEVRCRLFKNPHKAL